MEVKPVELTGKPKYPLKTELNEEDLKKQIPKRWIQSPAVKVALGTLAAVTLTGCTVQGGLAETTLITEATASAIDAVMEGEVLAPAIRVAPLFIHGGGVGSFGCMMVAPPAFLSEYEALTIINEAAKEYGLNFSLENTPEFANVLQPVTKMYPSLPPVDGAETTEITDAPDTIITLKADFSDNEHGIAIEYISTNDVEAWNQSEPSISAGAYHTMDAAAQLSEALESAYNPEGGEYVTGVLYDPCEPSQLDGLSDRKKRDEAAAKAREMSEEQLKAQAQDFFKWLRSQEVI